MTLYFNSLFNFSSKYISFKKGYIILILGHIYTRILHFNFILVLFMCGFDIIFTSFF